MLEVLLKKNKLEYVHIKSGLTGKNVIESIIISFNFENLKYFYVFNGENKITIILDISK